MTGRITAFGGIRRAAATLAVLAAGLLAGGCGGGPVIVPASEQPLSRETLALLARKGMDPSAPVFIRIFKEESELEVWKARAGGRFYHFKTYPICQWSGELGPKLLHADRQAPEGFYTVSSSQMNPASKYHLAFNLGYPNAYDRAHNRTGEYLMVHGKCKSAGCYAMTDALMEEIYGLAREALKGGQQSFEVHAFPFRMTAANMVRHKDNRWYPFWQVLKQGYDHFEKYRLPPMVAVCERRYVVNVSYSGVLQPDGTCPRFARPRMTPFAPEPSGVQTAGTGAVPGTKLRTAAETPLTPPPPVRAVRRSLETAAPADSGSAPKSVAVGFAR